mgnify:CR=1 FL=1
MHFLIQEATCFLEIFSIGNKLTLRFASPLFLDNYKENNTNGYFILIDEGTNGTVAVGFKN